MRQAVVTAEMRIDKFLKEGRRKKVLLQLPSDGHVSILYAVNNCLPVSLHRLGVNTDHLCKGVQGHIPDVVVLVGEESAREKQSFAIYNPCCPEIGSRPNLSFPKCVTKYVKAM